MLPRLIAHEELWSGRQGPSHTFGKRRIHFCRAASDRRALRLVLLLNDLRQRIISLIDGGGFVFLA